uniref:Ig-like domain-containing protein n=1 Tax=Felis catus TaxID=9685 RepID=A0ABI7XTP1_FELCA
MLAYLACFILVLLCQHPEHLSKPKVTMGLQNNKNGTCLTNLTCFMDQGGEDVTYSWESLGQAANESHNGSILPISWRLGERDTIFICVVRNPISSNSSNPIFAWKLCEENYSRGKSRKNTLFLSANTSKDGGARLYTHIPRHTNVIYL